MNWPYLSTSWCPDCERDIVPRLWRWFDDAAEYECPDCGTRHTRKPDDPAVYPFYPLDVLACLDDTLMPFASE